MLIHLHTFISLSGSPEEDADPVASVVEVLKMNAVGGASAIVGSLIVTVLPSLMMVLEVDTVG